MLTDALTQNVGAIFLPFTVEIYSLVYIPPKALSIISVLKTSQFCSFSCSTGKSELSSYLSFGNCCL